MLALLRARVQLHSVDTFPEKVADRRAIMSRNDKSFSLSQQQVL